MPSNATATPKVPPIAAGMPSAKATPTANPTNVGIPTMPPGMWNPGTGNFFLQVGLPQGFGWGGMQGTPE